MIAILGAGAFGTALGVAMARSGTAVMLWSHDAAHRAEMARSRTNARRLPDVDFPNSLTLLDNLADLPAGVPVLLAAPMQKLRALLESHGAALKGHPLVACCKGVELTSQKGPIAIIEELTDETAALLTGPSFAKDIARGLPTALTLACADDAMGARLQEQLSCGALRLYRTTDTIGAELGGALKNVIAIACGACIGEGMGDSARAALMTRGFAEMTRLAARLGARPETMTGLSGLGDLALTCTSDLSRNYRFGLALGRDEPFDASLTVEGVKTAEAVTALAKTLGLDMPICAMVHQVSGGDTSVAEAITYLLNRPLKEE